MKPDSKMFSESMAVKNEPTCLCFCPTNFPPLVETTHDWTVDGLQVCTDHYAFFLSMKNLKCSCASVWKHPLFS